MLELDISTSCQNDFLWNHPTAGSLFIVCALNVSHHGKGLFCKDALKLSLSTCTKEQPDLC